MYHHRWHFYVFEISFRRRTIHELPSYMEHISCNLPSYLMLSYAFLASRIHKTLENIFLTRTVNRAPTLLGLNELFVEHKTWNSFHVLQWPNQMKVINERLQSCLELNAPQRKNVPLTRFHPRDRKTQ